MAEQSRLKAPWLVAVWPGMGNVAINAGIYLLAKLGMHLLSEITADELFEIEHVEVKDGLIRTAGLPRSRFFVRADPRGEHDLVLFIGEAQPPIGKRAFCRRMMQYVEGLGVERVYTFAAMATGMRPGGESRVFGAATNQEGLEEIKRLEVTVLEDGQISGLNGVLLGIAAERGMRGACLLGEMPHVFAQAPYPRASLGVLEAFVTIAGLDLDLSELREQAGAIEEKMKEFLTKMEEQLGGTLLGEGEEGEEGEGDEAWRGGGEEAAGEEAEQEKSEKPAGAGNPRLSEAARRRLEEMFAEAARDRSKGYVLKQELDRLGVFREYEDRFLDLFRAE